MATSLIARARRGDEDAFRALTEPHFRELHAHCYRMLGSVPDAEDALQETLVSAWKGLAGFSEQASLRTWLYRIATNTCLNALRAQRRRPAKAWDIPGLEPPMPTRRGEVPWLGAYPNPIDSATELPIGPEARYEQTESISLAFVTALQLLPPRQLAVLVLRDVLGFPANDVADMLNVTVASVNNSLVRARTNLAKAHRTSDTAAPLPDSAEEREVVSRFARAFESSDLPALVALFTDDVFIAMPPLAEEYEGIPAATAFMRMLLVPGRDCRLIPTRANGQPAFGAYRQDSEKVWRASGLFVLRLAGDRIRESIRFEADCFASFGLPLEL
ncbi:MAG: RNA polymerase subunit sigma-70 [Marmoricola sp.]